MNEPYSWNKGVFTIEYQGIDIGYQGIDIGYQGVCGTMVKCLTEALIFRRFSHLKRRVLPSNQEKKDLHVLLYSSWSL